jgi:hypothetical protein
MLSGSATGLRSARCVANIQSDQVSSSFLGAGGIFNSINCDATGSLPIEARSDLLLLCVNSGTCPGTVACPASFVIDTFTRTRAHARESCKGSSLRTFTRSNCAIMVLVKRISLMLSRNAPAGALAGALLKQNFCYVLSFPLKKASSWSSKHWPISPAARSKS